VFVALEICPILLSEPSEWDYCEAA